MFDVHLRLGLEDHRFRIPKTQWGFIIENWLVAGEDVVLRASHKNHETNLILRGSASGLVSVTSCDPDRNLPVYNAFSVVDMRKAMLKDQGIE